MVVTLLYLTAAASPYTPATLRGAWDDTGGQVTRALQYTPVAGGASTTVARAEATATTPYHVLLYRGVSEPLAAQTIAGTVDVVLGVHESDGAADLCFHLHIYVTQGDSDTPRGTLLSDYVETTSDEWPTTNTGRALASAQALSSLAVSAGDRIVVEVGYIARNSVATSYTGTLRYGTSDGFTREYPDLTAGSTATSSRAPYVSFPSGIDLAQDTSRTTQAGIEVATESATLARTTQAGIEVAWQLPIDARVTQVGVEVLWTPPPPTQALFTLPGALEGLEGPLLWLEFHHPALADPLVISPVVLADPATYYYGFKAARVLRVDDVQLALADKTGEMQANRFTFELADFIEGDAAPIVRSWLGQVGLRALRRIEVVARMITDAGRRRFETPVTIFRGLVDAYAGLDQFRVRVECLSWIDARLSQPVLTTTVGEIFSAAPLASRDRVIPLALGRLTDEDSDVAAPTIVEDEAGRGSTAPPDPTSGYGDLPVAAPTGVTAVEAAGVGALTLGLVPGNTFYVWWTRLVGGVEGDPEPFLPTAALPVTISADAAAIDTACDADGADAYRAYLGFNYFGVRAVQYLETTDPEAGVRFTHNPIFGDPTPLTPGAVAAINPYAYAAVAAITASGQRTPLSVDVYLYSIGHRRPVRFAWTPVSGAARYEVYFSFLPPGPERAFGRRFTIAADQLNGNSDVYWEYDWSETGYVEVDGVPVPTGKIVPVDVGDITDPGGMTWGAFLISGRPIAAFASAYIGGVKLDDTQYGVDLVAPGRTGYDTNFGADPFYTIGGLRCAIVFLRGPLLEAARAAQQAPETLPARRAAATIGSGDSEVLVEVEAAGPEGNQYAVSVVDGVGTNQPLLASLAGTTLVVILATDGAGAPDDAANTAIKVAQVINGVHGFVAGVTAAGTDPVAAQTVTPMGGGADEGQAPGNPYQGEFRVNVLGLDADDDGTGTVVDDLYEIFYTLACHLLLADTPSLAGAWTGAIPTFQAGPPRLDETAWTQARAEADQVVPAGAVGGRYLATPITWGALLAEWSLSAGAKLGINDEGQLTLAVRNPSAAATVDVDHQFEILDRGFSFRDRSTGFATRTPYGLRPRYDSSGDATLTEFGEVEAADVAAEYDADIADDTQEYGWRDDAAAARQLASASLLATQHPARTVEATSVLHWLHFPLGAVIAVTHPEGPRAGGYQRHKLQILGKRLRPDGCTVTLTLDDLRTQVGDLSFFESEDFMAGRYIGGSRNETCVTESGIVVPFDWLPIVIDWDEIPGTHGQRARIQVATDAGTVTPAVFLEGEDPSGDTAVVEGTAHTSATLGEQVLTIPRPSGNGVVRYWMLPILAGGAVAADVTLLGQVEGYRV